MRWSGSGLDPTPDVYAPGLDYTCAYPGSTTASFYPGPSTSGDMANIPIHND